MSKLNERPVWPIFAWIGGGLTALTFTLVVAGLWIDPRFAPLAWFFGLPGLIMLICAGGTALESNTYTKKPRGWRKMRRDAERQAYIAELEREVGYR